MKPVISIIVPVYNAEPYIRKCLDSILAQTFTDFELILVNDGSPDCCGDICEAYAKKDGRILVVHQENRGVSAARNAGIERAKGEYIAFADPDDEMEPNMYAVLYEHSSKHDAELVVCQYVLRDEADNSVKIPQVWPEVDCIVDQETIIKEIMPNVLVNNTFSLVPCYNKLYKRELFIASGIRFDEGKSYGEDRRLNFSLLPHIQSLVFVEQPLYHYVRHQRESLSKVFREDFYATISTDKQFFIEICKSCNLDNYIDTVRKLFTTNALLHMQDIVNHAGLGDDRKKELLSEVMQDPAFKQDIGRYKADSVFYSLLKYACLFGSPAFLQRLIRWKYKMISASIEA